MNGSSPLGASRASPAGSGDGPGDEAGRVRRGFALSYLAMLPLIGLYEAASNTKAASPRNVAEVILSLPFDTFPNVATQARWILIAVGALAAAWITFHAELNLGARLWRIFLEGFLAAVLLGPCLLLLMHALGASPGSGALRLGPPVQVPRLAEAALVCGGSAYEEIVFRVGMQGLFCLGLRPLLAFLGAGDRWSRRLSDALALIFSALTFAAAHLSSFTRALGPGGENFDASVFTWRTLAGMFLGGLFLWRGPGVAAWTHAFFNLALFIGAGPDVFL